MTTDSLPSQRPEISVVLPVYRNAAQLAELHERLAKVLGPRGPSYELLFVDDACPERSLEELKRLAEKDAAVAVLSLGDNVGQHRAVMIGLRFARGRQVVIMDADLQDPPEALPILLNALNEEDWDAVFAGRRGRYEPWFRLLTSWIFKRSLHLVCAVPRDAGMFVAISRMMVEQLLVMDGQKPFVVSMIGCSKLPNTSIPVERDVRQEGRSAYRFRDRLRSAWRGYMWVANWQFRGLGGRLGWRHGRRFAEPRIEGRLGARFRSEDHQTVTGGLET